MTMLQSVTGRTREVIGTGSLCAVPFGSHGGGSGTLAEIGPLALLVAGFAGVAAWMFRRYGGKGGAPAVDGLPPSTSDDIAPARPGHPASA